MSGSAAFTRLLSPSVKNVLKKIGHKPSGGQIVKSQKISVFIMLSSWIRQAMGIVSVDQMVLRHLFFANSIFTFTIRNY